MKKINNISILILGTLVLIACTRVNDGPYDNCDRYYFTKDFKDYVLFHEGSYWIYKDTLHNIQDSIILTNQSLELNDYCDMEVDFEEIVYQTYHSSYFLSQNVNSLHGYASEATLEGEGVFGYYADWTDIGIINGVTFNKVDSLEINNKWFYDIKIISIDSLHEYYWARNIGLIKKVIPDPSINSKIYLFEIERYNIE